MDKAEDIIAGIIVVFGIILILFCCLGYPVWHASAINEVKYQELLNMARKNPAMTQALELATTDGRITNGEYCDLIKQYSGLEATRKLHEDLKIKAEDGSL